MEKSRPWPDATVKQLRVIGVGILAISALAPVAVTAEAQPTVANTEQAYIPQELDYIPDDVSVILK